MEIWKKFVIELSIMEEEISMKVKVITENEFINEI